MECKPVRIIFHPKHHRYVIQGVGRVPSITEVLVNSGRINQEWFTEQGKRRGTCVHDAINAYLVGRERYIYIKDEWQGYFAAFRRFQMQTEMQCVHSEKITGSIVHKFACRVDLVCWLNKRLVVVDAKTGSKGAVTHQVAANRIALAENGIRTEVGFALELRENGSYRLLELPYNDQIVAEVVKMIAAIWETERWQAIHSKNEAKTMLKSKPKRKH